MGKEKNIIKFYNKRNIEIVQGKSSHSFPKHSHNGFCIGIITSGVMRLNIQEQEYLLEKDDVYFIPPHIEHTISAVNEVGYEYTVLCIHNNVEKCRNKLLGKYVFKEKVVRMEIINMIQQFKDINNEYFLEDMILKLLRKYIEIYYFCKKETSNEIIQLAVAFIKNSLNESFNLDKLSQYTNITKYHLIRLFKNQMGVTPNQFYIQEKIKRIRKGLLKQQPISDLVFNFNFSDESHLCNTFKKHIGITPMQFKDSYINLN